jgi:GNAT superfamily N-acetyltransferase
VTCRTVHITDLVSTIGFDRASMILHRLTRNGSDFARKLTTWLYTSSKPTPNDGVIAVVEDYGEVIGWARTERWSEPLDEAGSVMHWDTLEAFVAPEYRSRGVAAFAASGLYATALHDGTSSVAVFRPAMLLVARRAGFVPTLFDRRDGRWVRS